VSDPRDLAIVELLGAMTYGQLRMIEVTARAIRFAPDAERADRLAGFAVGEHASYVLLRDALQARTDLAAPVIDRQRPRFDAYFDAMPLDDWLGMLVFIATGLPIAADFSRQVSQTLDDDLAPVVVAALAERDPFEAFALEHARRALRAGDGDTDRVRHLVADIVGRALTGFQGAIADTDALRVLFADLAEQEGVTPEALVKRVAIDVLAAHRHRMYDLGLDDLA